MPQILARSLMFAIAITCANGFAASKQEAHSSPKEPAITTPLVKSGSKARTGLCGKLEENLTLIRSHSPYLLVGDLWVPKGFTLNIEPGVEIRVRPGKCPNPSEIPQWNWADSQYVAIKIEGSFAIFGKPDLPVVLKADQGNGVRWAGVMIRGPLKNNEGTGIQFAHFMNAHRGIWAQNTRFNVMNSLFEGNHIGIEMAEKADLRIGQNTFAKNRSAGVVQRGALPQIYGNIFYQNGDMGIGSDGRRGPNIGANLFWGHTMDCLKCPPQVGLRQGNNPDRFDNLFTDPIFVGTQAEKAARQADPRFKSQNPQNPVIAQTAAIARDKKRAGIAPSPESFTPRGHGPWRLSFWSPARQFGPKNFYFSNPDGSRGEMGMHGGGEDRALKNWPSALW